MKLLSKLLLLVTGTVAMMVLISVLVLNTQVRDFLQENNKDWLEQMVASVAESVANDTIHNRRLKVRNLLEQIVTDGKVIKYLYITDLQGKVFAHSFYGGFPQALAEHLARSHPGHLSDKDNELRESWRYKTGKEYITEYEMPLIEGTVSHIYVGISHNNINHAINQALQSLSTIMVLVGLFAIWLVVIIGRHISQPLLRLTEEINNFAGGKSSPSFNISSTDRDINRLANAFNQMVESRQAAEEALLEREKRLSLTLNSIGDGVIATDGFGYVTRVNPVAEKLCGWKEEEAIGLPLTDVFKIINAHTRKTVENPVFKVMETGKIVGLANHTVLIAKDKHEHQIADSAAPIIDDQGCMHGVILVFRDVTKEYALQDSLALVQHMAQIGSWMLDLLTGELSWSDEVYRIFEIDRGKAPSYELFLSLIHPEDRDRVSHVYEKSVETRQPYEVQHRLLMPDGRVKIVIERAKTYYNEDGDAIQSVGSVQDVTEARAMEEQLNRAQKMDALGKLTGGIAHDYNNMLGIIMGYAEILQGQLANDPDLSKYAREIYQAGERGSKLTRRLLSFSRQQISSANSCILNTVLQDNLLMLEKTLTASVQLQLNLSKELWTVWIDRGDFDDALLNMSINAMHAMNHKGVLTISTCNTRLSSEQSIRLSVPAGDYVCMTICDTGYGMNTETISRIFDPFYTTKGEMGTGLGLSQVYGFMQRCKGGVEVASEPGKGACFKLYFPRYVMQQSEQPSADTESIDTAAGGYESILLVDDEKGLRDLGADILSRAGYKVIVKENAKQALEYLQSHSVDLLLTDIIMPDMDGYQLVEAARELIPGLKVQVTTGYSGGLHRTSKDPDLHKHILLKPYTSKALLMAVRRSLDETISH